MAVFYLGADGAVALSAAGGEHSGKMAVYSSDGRADKEPYLDSVCYNADKAFFFRTAYRHKGTVFIPYTKPCHGTSVVELPIDAEEINNIRKLNTQ